MWANTTYVEPVSRGVACRSGRFSARRRGQSVVEFGLVVVLFVLLISGMFDFGLLLNARLSISSMSRVLARAAAENASDTEVVAMANKQEHIIGVTTDSFTGGYVGVGDPSDTRYAVVITKSYYDQAGSLIPVGQPHAPGDRVMVEVTAKGMEVVNPMVRPVFKCFDGTQRHCFVAISAQTTMRVERTYP